MKNNNSDSKKNTKQNNDITVIDSDSIDIYINDIDLYFNLYCEENRIEDMRKESQAVFLSCLYYIYCHVFKDNMYLLKINQREFNPDNVYKLCIYYIYSLCNKYNKIPSMYGFSTLSGIDIDTLLSWNSNNDTYKTEHNKQRNKVYRLLKDYRQMGLADRIADGKTNPVGPIAILNHEYNWQTAAAAQGTQKPLLSSADLPDLLTDNENISES